jgi:galactose mutarotase-like enzyme
MTVSVTLRSGRARAVVRSRGAHISSFVVPQGDATRETLMVAPWSPADGQSLLPGSGNEWHRTYTGGWHPLIPRLLGPAEVNGIHQPYHGESAWLDWHVDATSESSTELVVALRTVPLHLLRRVTLKADAAGAVLDVRTTVTNYGVDRVDFGWGEHPTLAADLFDGGQVDIDEFTRPVVAAGEMDFHVCPTRSVEARVSAPGATARLTWDSGIFTHLYIWQERGAGRAFPWYGRANALAVEPASQRPDVERTVLGPLTLEAQESLTADVTLRVELAGS